MIKIEDDIDVDGDVDVEDTTGGVEQILNLKDLQLKHLAVNMVIERHSQRFKQMPFGPIGTLIRLPSIYHEDFMKSVGRSFLLRYVFGEQADMKQLRRLCAEEDVLCNIECFIVDAEQTFEPSRLGCFEDMCVISSVLVRNCLRVNFQSHMNTLDELLGLKNEPVVATGPVEVKMPVRTPVPGPAPPHVTPHASNNVAASSAGNEAQSPLKWMEELPDVLQTGETSEGLPYMQLDKDVRKGSIFLEMIKFSMNLGGEIDCIAKDMPSFPPMIEDEGYFLFMVKSDTVQFEEALFSDGLVPWSQTEPPIHPKKDIFHVIQKDGAWAITKNKEEANEDVHLVVMRGFLPRCQRLHKRVAFLSERKKFRTEKKVSRLLSPVMVIYAFRKPGDIPTWTPHGNSLTPKPWYREKPSLIRQMRSLLETKPPRDVLIEVQKEQNRSVDKSKIYYANRDPNDRKRSASSPLDLAAILANATGEEEEELTVE